MRIENIFFTIPFFLGLGDGPHKTNIAIAIANPILANTATFSTSIFSKSSLKSEIFLKNWES